MQCFLFGDAHILYVGAALKEPPKKVYLKNKGDKMFSVITYLLQAGKPLQAEFFFEMNGKQQLSGR